MRKPLTYLALVVLCFIAAAANMGKLTTSPPVQRPGFYVATDGNDANDGSIEHPFATLEKALTVVNQRVDQGIEGDDIYIRGGIYRLGAAQERNGFILQLNLRGSSADYTLISAMPCQPKQSGCVQKLSGAWYEEVIFDEAHTITTPWLRYENTDIWVTDPQYGTTSSTVEPSNRLRAWRAMWGAMLLIQEKEKPLLWVNSIEEIRQPGQRFYDKDTGKLYAHLYEDKDPNQVVMESWQDDFDRTLFGGTVTYVKFVGLGFRFQHRLFTAPRNDHGVKWNMVWEDNTFLYGDRHFTHDVNSNQFAEEGVSFNQIKNWTIRYNLIYRPCREVFQFFGDGHVVEHNHVIEHAGGWCGPATGWSIANMRNAPNVQVIYNYIKGKGRLNENNAIGSIFMLELYSDHRTAADNAECVFGGQTFAYNLFEDITSAAIITIPHGGCINKDITIMGNIFKSGTGRTRGIMLSTPQHNLKVTNNIFYNIPTPVYVHKKAGAELDIDSGPSTMTFSRNIFTQCKDSFSPELLNRDGVTIDDNLFFKCMPLAGANSLNEDPLFMDPAANDFRLSKPSPALRQDSAALGAYEQATQIPPGADWWNLKVPTLPSLKLYNQ